jgi:hypothetical protein
MTRRSLKGLAFAIAGVLTGSANVVLAQPGCANKAVVYNTETKKNECCGTGYSCVVCPRLEEEN